MIARILCILVCSAWFLPAQEPAAPSAPADVKPGSITYEEIEYPYPVAFLPLPLYGQDVRMAYMDVPPAGQSKFCARRASVLLCRTRSDSAVPPSQSFPTIFTTWR